MGHLVLEHKSHVVSKIGVPMNCTATFKTPSGIVFEPAHGPKSLSIGMFGCYFTSNHECECHKCYTVRTRPLHYSRDATNARWCIFAQAWAYIVDACICKSTVRYPRLKKAAPRARNAGMPHESIKLEKPRVGTCRR